MKLRLTAKLKAQLLAAKLRYLAEIRDAVDAGNWQRRDYYLGLVSDIDRHLGQ